MRNYHLARAGCHACSPGQACRRSSACAITDPILNRDYVSQFRALSAVLFTAFTLGFGTVVARGQDLARDIASDNRGALLFQRMLQADSTLTLEGDQVTEVNRNGRHIHSTQHVIQNGLSGKRVTYVSPPGMVGAVVVDDGTTVWRYYPRRNALEQGQSQLSKQRMHVPQTLRALKRGNIVVTVAQNETVAGRPCTVIQVHRRGDPGPWREFWVDNATGAPLQTVQHQPNGSRDAVTYFTRVSFNVPIAANAFSPPSTSQGVTVSPLNDPNQGMSASAVAGQAGFRPMEPTYLPLGFRFQSAGVSRFRNKSIMTQRFTNGQNTLSLFQTPAMRFVDRAPTYPRPDTVTMVIGGYRIVLVGNLSRDEMTRIITSVR